MADTSGPGAGSSYLLPALHRRRRVRTTARRFTGHCEFHDRTPTDANWRPSGRPAGRPACGLNDTPGLNREPERVRIQETVPTIPLTLTDDVTGKRGDVRPFHESCRPAGPSAPGDSPRVDADPVSLAGRSSSRRPDPFPGVVRRILRARLPPGAERDGPHSAGAHALPVANLAGADHHAPHDVSASPYADLDDFVAGTETVVAHHVASRGHK